MPTRVIPCASAFTRSVDVTNLRKNVKAAGRFKDLDDLENLPLGEDAP